MKGIFLYQKEVTPSWDLATAEYLLTSLSQPILHIASLTGEGISIGRFQNLTSAMKIEECERRGIPIYRRLTGGRSLSYGEGIMVLSLILPHPSILLQEIIPPVKVINRYVRGILKGLTSLGIKCLYPGDNFLLLNRKSGGYLSVEVTSQGSVLFQAIIAVKRALPLPEEVSNYPSHSLPLRPWTTLTEELGRSIEEKEVSDLLRRGFESRFSVPFEPASLTAAQCEIIKRSEERHSPLVRETPPLGLRGRSGVKEIPIGYLEVGCEREADQIRAVQIWGDFIAPSWTIAAVEEKLVGSPLLWKEIGSRVDRVFANPNHFLMGVRALSVIPDAVLEAAAKGVEMRS